MSSYDRLVMEKIYPNVLIARADRDMTAYVILLDVNGRAALITIASTIAFPTFGP
jgi:hypothetical protein